MTREEAIEVLKNTEDNINYDTKREEIYFTHKWVGAYEMAIAALREQENPTSCNKVSNKEKMLESNRICSGCRWKGVRHQRCSCCCRNLYLKDNYEEDA